MESASGEPREPLPLFLGAHNAIVARKKIAGFTWNRGTNQIQADRQFVMFPTVGLGWRF
jgi:hypothetical protein